MSRRDDRNRRSATADRRGHGQTLFLLAVFSALATNAAPFGLDRLVIYRVGSGGSSLNNAATPVFLDEWTTNGTLVQSLPMPTVPGGGSTSHALTASGTASSEGLLTRSADGRCLLVPGYAATGGATAVSSSTAATWPRVVGVIGADGTIDTQTALTDAFSGNNIRGAAGADASNLWVVGASAPAVRFAMAGGVTSASVVAGGNYRGVAIAEGQLYVASGSGNRGVFAVGSGLPTGSSSTSLVVSAGSSSTANQFVPLRLGAPGSGIDTVYLADESIGLVKFSFTGSSWVTNGIVGSAADTYRGVTALRNGSNVTLYAVRKGGTGATGGGELVRLDDSSGFNGTFAGTPTLLASASANTSWRGIALSPASGNLPLVAFGAGGGSHAENAGTVQVEVVLDVAATGSVDIVSVGDAALGSDFLLSTNHLEFGTGQRTQTVAVTLIDDATVEAVETVALQLTNPIGLQAGGGTNFSFSVIDDDAVFVRFVATNVPGLFEGNATGLWVRTSRSADVTVNVAMAGSAIYGADFALSTTQLVFASGGPTDALLTVTCLQDVEPEVTETIDLTLVDAAGAFLLPQTNLLITLLDDEPTLRLSTNVAMLSETSGVYHVTVARSSTNNSVTCRVAVSGTAIPGVDFTVAPTNLVLAGGTTSVVVDITLINDVAIEPPETIELTLADIGEASAGTPATFVATLVDDDIPPPLTAGDIAIVGRVNNGAPDTFAVAALRDLEAGQTIYFTDNGWDGTRFRGASATNGPGNESLLKLEIVGHVSAGTILSSGGSDSNWHFVVTGTIPGTGGSFASLQLSNSGDQIYAFTAPVANPLFQPDTHLFVINDGGEGWMPATASTNGDIPPGLTNNLTALFFSNRTPTIALDMTQVTGLTLSKEGWLAFLADPQHWLFDFSGNLPVGALGMLPTVPSVSFGITSLLVTEAVTTVSIPVELTFSADATVEVARVSGDALPGVDFMWGPTQLVFVAGGPTTQSLDIVLADDQQIEATELATFALQQLRGCVAGPGTGLTMLLFDNDDTDGDGLFDIWEINQLGQLGSGPADDNDGDGVDNAGEWLAGTVPTNALSYPRLRRSPTPDVRWEADAIDGRTYQLEAADLPDAPAWITVCTSNASGNGPIALYDANPTNRARVYRLRILETVAP